MEAELDQNGYRTHEFGDFVLLSASRRTRTADRPARIAIRPAAADRGSPPDVARADVTARLNST
jgi:hypothetical protein